MYLKDASIIQFHKIVKKLKLTKILTIRFRLYHDLKLLINDLLKKEVSWKAWLDPRFSRHPKLKVNFKVTASREGLL